MNINLNINDIANKFNISKALEEKKLSNEFNFVVVSLDILLKETKIFTKSEIYLKINNIIPFVKKELAIQYCDNYPLANQVLAILPVYYGRIIFYHNEFDAIMLNNIENPFKITLYECRCSNILLEQNKLYDGTVKTPSECEEIHKKWEILNKQLNEYAESLKKI